ncbi:MAG: hypothetical protein SOR73_14025 [Romboutsia timonensis]|uniref:hypothetical protein n=1 Tax=Romboutsia timonensis TaxID=1776391 RepID=UPI002A74EE0D|nr:hypothetical protein [Romboutsia timonensis]MDY3002775.1 hypothetical protein [Romboutsia timonensis]
MAIFKRRRDILEGRSRVSIDSIVEKQHENGKVYFIIAVSRKSDRATRSFWIVEDSYLIEKIIDIFFKGDEREEFDTNEFIGKEIIIDVKKSDSNYFNITDIHPVDEYNYEDNDEEDNEYEEENLEDELFKEDSRYVEEDDDLDLDIDDDIFDLDDDDLPSQNLRNGRRR